MKKTDEKFDLPQGTLDLLIMRVVALGPIHGYAIAQRIQQISRDALEVQQGSLYPALHRLEYKKLLSSGWKPSKTGRKPSPTNSLPRDELISRLKPKTGRA